MALTHLCSNSLKRHLRIEISQYLTELCIGQQTVIHLRQFLRFKGTDSIESLELDHIICSVHERKN